MQESETNRQVKRRRVFYVPGYDPFHPRRYRELYRKESARQAEISGYEIGLKPKAGGKGPYGWKVRSVQDGAEVAGEIDVLVWHDIVKDSMQPGIGATYLQLARTAWAYIGSSALFRLMRLRKGPMIAALYPVFLLLGQLIFAVLAGFGFYQGVTLLLGDALWVRGLGALAGLALIWAILSLFRRHDSKVFAYYLMHDYAFSAQAGGANPPELETRMGEFADIIAGALESDVDEVLVVGHSSGAHLAVSILADLLRDGRVPEDGPILSFLSLGQVIPMVSFLPKAHRLRTDLHYLGGQERMAWVDVTAPGDGCSFALCDPVAVSGVASDPQLYPLVVSAAFTQTLSPEKWRAMRWKFFKLHFQYLCAFDRPEGYDYFRITAGPQTLAARFAERSPSRSRIVTPVNRFTDLAA